MAAQLPPAAPPRHIAPSAPLRAAQTGPRKTASSADEGWRGRGRGERGVGRSAPGCSASAPRVPPVPAGLAGSPTRRLSQPRSTPRLGQPQVSGLRASGLRAARPPPPSAGPSHSLSAFRSQAAAGPGGKGPVSGPSVPPDQPPWPPLAALIRVVGVPPTVSSAPSVSTLPGSASPEIRHLTRLSLVCTACLLCASPAPPPLHNLRFVCCAFSAAEITCSGPLVPLKLLSSLSLLLCSWRLCLQRLLI